ncbi:MAG TPA: glucose 1-dehydrogenase [Steroidobacteraceae bacterium]|nr:glucose 1-dehydrogenase [Steroidobacteraceae bacterium]
MGNTIRHIQRPNFSLDGKVAVITGASRGIGGSVAAALAHSGAAVALLGRDEPALAAAAAGLVAAGCQAQHFRADVADVSSIETAFEQVAQSLGRIDILINNAGIEQVCASLDVTEALWDQIVGTNLKGAFFAAQAAGRRMSSGGSIVNMCSLTSEVGVAGAAAYGASKSGLAGLTRALATEWAARGIRVNGIGPGYFRTALTESFYRDEQWQDSMLSKIPLGRFGVLDDLCGATVFLCSDAAAYITGQILYIDGGYLAAL